MIIKKQKKTDEINSKPVLITSFSIMAFNNNMVLFRESKTAKRVLETSSISETGQTSHNDNAILRSDSVIN
jgi:hypothetical protein